MKDPISQKKMESFAGKITIPEYFYNSTGFSGITAQQITYTKIPGKAAERIDNTTYRILINETSALMYSAKPASTPPKTRSCERYNFLGLLSVSILFIVIV